MPKIDLKKELKHLYSASAKEFTIVDVPNMNFLMIDGLGDPNTSQWFQQAIEALYAVSFTLKFMVKKSAAVDYVVAPPEGLWWTEGPAAFDMENREAWKWTLMVMQPQYVVEQLVSAALVQVNKKKNLPALENMKFESLQEGLAAQILHVGPYSAETETIERIHTFLKGKGYRLRGKHHEIYLSDPRRTAPGKLKTIIRHPIE